MVQVALSLLAVLSASAPASPLLAPDDLLHECWNIPAKAEATHTGAPVNIAGRVERVQSTKAGIVVDLHTDERSFRVRCAVLTEESRASDLVSGQLVALRCVGAGTLADRPQLKDCAVLWAGERPGALSARSAQVAVASLRICGNEKLKDLLASQDARHDCLLAEAAKAAQLARAELKSLGEKPLPCGHPLLFLLERCMGLGLFDALKSSQQTVIENDFFFWRPAPPPPEPDASECGAPQINAAVRIYRPVDGWACDQRPETETRRAPDP